MTKKDLIEAVKAGKLYWNDPDPIKGNDYRVTSIQVCNSEMSMITYNDGTSEAEVYNHELWCKIRYEVKSNQYLPNGFGRPAATYYYVANEKGQSIDFKTRKPYSGKQMDRYMFYTQERAEAFAKEMNQ